ncbi:MAG: AGE family epimerase/isomerase [Ignavibacteriales bacterium]|nr:AGE family epimerase/isomerase [Ignavibacteriales bacterium]
MTNQRIEELLTLYRRTLLEDVVPFWLNNAIDRTHGGILNCLDRDGSVYNTDKAMWIQCRAVWTFSKLYNEVEQRPEWLDAARSGYEFITRHGFDSDGRMFFVVTRDGRPLRKSRYLFTETFGTIACAEYSKASGDQQALLKARETYRLVIDLYRNPGRLTPKVIPETRVTKAHAMPMILLATTQELRKVDDDPLYTAVADQALYEVLHHFMKPDRKALFEIVGPNGEMLDSPEGRCVNPGHAIETSWFMMHEALHRSDQSLLRSALDVLRWSLELGWDKEFGGIFSFIDVEGKPTEQLEWDMKLWWPHTEALYALLTAHHLTGDSLYEQWYERVHAWSFAHFPDPQHGEWFGYLHRDGSVSSQLKGSMWKGPFHLPRALLYGWKVLEKMRDARKS